MTWSLRATTYPTSNVCDKGASMALLSEFDFAHIHKYAHSVSSSAPYIYTLLTNINILL